MTMPSMNTWEPFADETDACCAAAPDARRHRQRTTPAARRVRMFVQREAMLGSALSLFG
jgi:hypothetical protein